nr:photosystem II reaction center protein PsbW [Kitasatospora cheerisanensis]
MGNVDKRNAMRAGAVTAAATLMMLMSSPAMALVRDDGDDPGTGLSVGETLGLYVALPIVSFLVIAGLCMIPGKKK